MFQSETYELLDAMYFDDGTSDTHANYTINRASYTHNTDSHTITRSSDGDVFVDLRINDTTNYVGKTIKFETDIVESDKSVQIRIYEIINGSAVTKTTSSGASSGILVTEAVTISNNATSVYFRLMAGNLGTSESCTFKNFKIYVV